MKDKKRIQQHAALIESLGGPAVLAKKLGYADGGVQRVTNWRKRGIPAEVRLERSDVFGAPEASQEGVGA